MPRTDWSVLAVGGLVVENKVRGLGFHQMGADSAGYCRWHLDRSLGGGVEWAVIVRIIRSRFATRSRQIFNEVHASVPLRKRDTEKQPTQYPTHHFRVPSASLPPTLQPKTWLSVLPPSRAKRSQCRTHRPMIMSQLEHSVTTFFAPCNCCALVGRSQRIGSPSARRSASIARIQRARRSGQPSCAALLAACIGQTSPHRH